MSKDIARCACGKKPKLILCGLAQNAGQYIECRNCERRGLIKPTIESAIDDWNEQIAAIIRERWAEM